MKKYFFLFSVFLLTSCGASEPAKLSTTVPETPKTILALGDSLTAGYGLPESDSYPSQLEKKLREVGYDYRLINAWISWDTTAWLLSRLDWVLEWDTPSLVILCIGANDAFQGKSVADIESNLRSIIEKIQSKNIAILFAGMRAPLNLGWDYGSAYEAIFPRIAKEYKLPFMPFFLQWVALKWTLNQDDRIHPNKEWYAVVVENLVKVLEKEKLITK